jgi:hypothetical protein
MAPARYFLGSDPAACIAVNESDLDYLDKWLSSYESPRNSMMLSDLDGFLRAVATGPEVIRPDELVRQGWRDRPPV